MTGLGTWLGAALLSTLAAKPGVLRADLALRLAGALRRCFSGVSLNASRARGLVNRHINDRGTLRGFDREGCTFSAFCMKNNA